MTKGFTRGRGANRKFIPTEHDSSSSVRMSGRKHSSMSGRLPRNTDPADRSSANYYKNARAMEDHGYVEVPDSIYGGRSRYTLKNGKSITLKSGLTKVEVERAIEFDERPPIQGHPKAVSGQGPLVAQERLEKFVETAKERREDRITKDLEFPEFRVDIPVHKAVPGEETFAEQQVGTQFESRSKGKPINALYSPEKDTYVIIDGHHRWAEAKASGNKTVEGWVSIINDEKGFGALTDKQLEAKIK